MPVPGGQWAFTINAAGRYEFVNRAGGAAPSHSGEFTARDGEWTLHATSMALEDHGRYELAPNGQLKLTGNRGAIQWAHSEAPAATGATGGDGCDGHDARIVGEPRLAINQRAAHAKPERCDGDHKRPGDAGSRCRATHCSAHGCRPDTIDPCLLVTAEEASQLLGAAVQPERTTPQPHRRTIACIGSSVRCVPCRSRLSTAMASTPLHGSGGCDRWAARRGRSRRGAVFKYNTALGITDVGFVIGTASFTVTIGGVPRDRAEPAARAFAANMAKRVTSGAGGAATPGLERFVGTWMAHLPQDQRVVWWIERDGRVRVQGSGGFQGQMVLNGANWKIDVPFNQSATGTYSVTSDRLKIGGPTLVADLTRVSCGKSPQAQLPFDYTMLLAARLNGKLTAINPQADAKGFDARLAGLWEGEGTVGQQHAVVLASIDDRGRSLFALFPTALGKFEASGGQFKLTLDGEQPTSGTYQFQGGVAEGTVQMRDKDETFSLSPYRPESQSSVRREDRRPLPLSVVRWAALKLNELKVNSRNASAESRLERELDGCGRRAVCMLRSGTPT